ncbi:MAG: DinB family protein [Chloroflexota bacterium]
MTAARQDLLDRLAQAPSRAAAAAARAGDPIEGGWTARQVVLHLIAVEDEVWHARLGDLATKTNPQWSWVEPSFAFFPGDDSIDNVVGAFAARRADTIEQLAALDDAGWAKFGTHDTYGVLDVEALVIRALDHDAEHLATLEGLAGG